MERNNIEQIRNDEEAVKLISFLYEGGPDSEEKRSEIWDCLEKYQLGIAEVFIKSKEKLPPEEILRLARERNKPILL
jgi:hypothetical protein